MVVGYSTNYIFHTNPVLSINNADEGNQTFPLFSQLTNSIFYAEEGIVNDKIAIPQSGNNSFNLNFENVSTKQSIIYRPSFLTAFKINFRILFVFML